MIIIGMKKILLIVDFLMINYCNIMIEMWKAHSAMEVFAMRFAHCVCYYIFFMTRLSNSMHRKEIIMREMCYSSGENVDFDGFDDEVLHWYWRPGHGLHLGRLGCTAVPTAHSRMHNAHQATIAHTHWHAGARSSGAVKCSAPPLHPVHRC